jgi:hypothetical protein
MSASVRDALVDELRRVLGTGVHVVPYQDNVDALDRRTVMVKQTTISPLPEAPAGQLRIDYVLTFISPNVDPGKAERDLDQWVPQTLADLTMSWLAWTSAEKTLFDPQNVSYDVAVFVLTTTRNEE